MEAHCNRFAATHPGHKAEIPEEECTCGIYITPDPHIAFAYGPILGRVYGWGRRFSTNRGGGAAATWKEIYSVFEHGAEVFVHYGVPVHLIDTEQLKNIVLGDKGEKARNPWYVAACSRCLRASDDGCSGHDQNPSGLEELVSFGRCFFPQLHVVLGAWRGGDSGLPVASR